ncbi:MAG: methyltransferase domain-containing protein [Myxococcales bacterium]|nr:methyltransferase domain-containing protein [Myxococcales bacterium]
MRSNLLSILAEPGTGSPLEIESVFSENQTGIYEGTLVSVSSGKKYPVVRGIPRFVEGESYAESFGRQWNQFRCTQLDSQNGGGYTHRRFYSETGWCADELRDKWVLDAGCGAGRFAEIAAKTGCRLVCLDYSSAVEAVRETTASLDNVDVVQGSLLEPPFRPGVFDYTYCIGVIQHTPDPNLAVEKVVWLTRRGGSFAMTIYARRPWTKLHAKYFVRPLTTRLPQEVLLRGIKVAMPLVYPLASRAFSLPIVGRIFQFTWPVAVYSDRKDLSSAQRYEESILDTLDMLSPTHDHPMTAGEVDAVLQTMGAQRWNFQTRRPVNVLGVH